MLRAMFFLPALALGGFFGAALPIPTRASPIPEHIPRPAIAVRYTVTDCGTIGFPPTAIPTENNGASIPTAINNKGEVVGYNVFPSAEENHGFVYSGGTMHDVGSFHDYESIAYGINDRSEVVGTVYGHDAPEIPGEEALLYKDGQLTNLYPLGLSVAVGINNFGQITGYGSPNAPVGDNNASSVFRYVQGHLVFQATVAGSVPSVNLDTSAINNRGQVVGSGYFLQTEVGTNDPEYVERAFLYSDGFVQDLGALGLHNSSYATALNENGQVVGNVEFPPATGVGLPTYHAFLYSRGQMRDIGTLGGNYSFALGINYFGVIVGSSYLAGYGPGNYDYADPLGDNTRAFVYIEGKMHDLNTLLAANPAGWVLEEAVGINDFGQIAVTGFAGNTMHALILTPVREPFHCSN